ncbi:hypothetical protein [Geobacter sulfurreducens]|uniref:hypothetical protein n=1 Tax=Geobacter sulfurreducens TaxID=35554 RepID=UPI0003017657|nr:hypothetical protein [Geobacter sulfurreducens]
MRKHLILLEELQELDLKIDGRQGERQALLDQLAELDRQVEEARLAVDGIKAELAAAEEEKLSLEANLAAEDENIVRSEARQKEIKTQKEYQAILKEITAAKKQKGELEEQLLQKTGQVEQFVADIVAREGDISSVARPVPWTQDKSHAAFLS